MRNKRWGSGTFVGFCWLVHNPNHCAARHLGLVFSDCTYLRFGPVPWDLNSYSLCTANVVRSSWTSVGSLPNTDCEFSSFIEDGSDWSKLGGMLVKLGTSFIGISGNFFLVSFPLDVTFAGRGKGKEIGWVLEFRKHLFHSYQETTTISSFEGLFSLKTNEFSRQVGVFSYCDSNRSKWDIPFSLLHYISITNFNRILICCQIGDMTEEFVRHS